MNGFILSPELYAQVENHLQQALPQEACGIISGLANRAEAAYPITNRLHSATRFEMDPLELLEVMEKIEQQNLKILAFYHSHPHGPGHPSQTDLREFAYPGVLYLIWAPVEGRWRARCFEILGMKFAELELR